MTIPAVSLPQRRGACPGLSAPMPTGDGLLVRLTPIGTIPLAAFAALCRAARAHGNGVIEVSARGSLQVRGLNVASAPQFAAAVAALDMATADGVPVLSNALAGLDPEELIDAGALAADLRIAAVRQSLAARLAAKVSVAVDGGGALHLDGVTADVRLCAEVMNGSVVLCVGVAGDAMSASQLGFVASAHGVEAALRLLEVIAQRGPIARARDIVAAEGIAAFRSAIEGVLLSPAHPRAGGDPALDSRWRGNARKEATTLGLHRLRDGSFACGIGLGFGHADAASFERLTEKARGAGATGLRAAPGRALMAIGLTRQTAAAFADVAERLGFIVRADDPRRHVVACAGAPICASAYIAARAMAPRIAAVGAPHLDAASTIHISGCAKGCAHPGPAALTFVGTATGCAVIINGSARDAPLAAVPTDQLPAAVARLAQQLQRGGGHV